MGNRKNMVCTIFLIAMNVIVFIALSFGGMTEDAYYMFEHGAMYTPSFLYDKEYYRIFTSLFMHFGFEHLMNNMLMLGILGKYLEPAIGHVKFVLIYFLSGLGGNVLSMLGELKLDDYYVSAGASGAVFGLTGALLCLTSLYRGRIKGVTQQGMLFMIAISLYNGFTSTGVDNLAHLGGAIFGFIVTWILSLKLNREGRTDIYC